MEFTGEFTWCSSESAIHPKGITVDIGDSQFDSIIKSKTFLKENPDVSHVSIMVWGELVYEDEDKEADLGLDKVDMVHIMIYGHGGMYISATSKWDGNVKYEADLDYKELAEDYVLKKVIDKI